MTRQWSRRRVFHIYVKDLPKHFQKLVDWMGENCELLLSFNVNDTAHVMEMVNTDLQRKIIPAKLVVILVCVV